jgi:hypothetical protein
LHHIHPPIPFPTTSPLPMVPTAPSLQILFHPLVLWFCRRKKTKGKKRNMPFLLVWDKENYTGNFFVYYNTNLFISSNPRHSFLVPFPWWPQPV